MAVRNAVALHLRAEARAALQLADEADRMFGKLRLELAEKRAK